MQSFSESLNNPYPYKVHYEGFSVREFTVDAGDAMHIWVVRITRDMNGAYDIEFGTVKKALLLPGQIGMFNVEHRVSVGNPLRLFASISEMLQDYYSNARSFKFSSDNSDKTKIAVYRRLATRISNWMGGKVSEIDRSEEDALYFLITRH